MNLLKYLLILLTYFILIGCSKYSIENRLTLANNLAMSNGLIENNISTDRFIFRTYGKFSDNSKSIKIYIEGDGLAWIDKRTISSNPTPIYPIALRFASKDNSHNVFYIARPCQYNLDLNCNKDYWTKKRFSKEVIESFDQVINNLKKEYKFKDIEIIGFSGGGAIAMLLASQRDDVKKITTIAGNLNHKLVNKLHNVSPMSDSLNPIDIAQRTSYIPQIHYIGEKDNIITIDIVNSYIEASKSSKNIKAIVIKDATHTKGWDNINLE